MLLISQCEVLIIVAIYALDAQQLYVLAEALSAVSTKLPQLILMMLFTKHL